MQDKKIMLPILLIAKDKSEIENFLNNFLKKNYFPSSSILIFHPKDKLIKIDQIRQIESFLMRADERKKLIVIYDFHTAKPETQNAFLKTLEEKSLKAQFIIHSKSKEQIIATVLSRCKIIRLKEKNDYCHFSLINKSLFKNSLGKLLLLYQSMTQEKALDFCHQLILFLKEELIKTKNKKLIFLIKETIRLQSLIEKNNLNPQFTVDQLLIHLYQCYNEK